MPVWEWYAHGRHSSKLTSRPSWFCLKPQSTAKGAFILIVRTPFWCFCSVFGKLFFWGSWSYDLCLTAVTRPGRTTSTRSTEVFPIPSLTRCPRWSMSRSQQGCQPRVQDCCMSLQLGILTHPSKAAAEGNNAECACCNWCTTQGEEELRVPRCSMLTSIVHCCVIYRKHRRL